MFLDGIYNVELWIIFLVSVIIFIIFTEIGFQYGASRTKGKDEQVSELISNSVLGLLALLLGFTLSMAITRFEYRKSLVVKEANAIGTAYLRTKLFNHPASEKQRILFKKYLDHRLKYFENFNNLSTAQKYKVDANQMLNEIWSNGLQITKNDRSPLSAIYITSLNDVIDIHSERVFASENRVPQVIYLVINLTALLGISMISYVSGFKKHRHFSNYLLLFLFLSVITLIRDLDRPGRGTIRVDQGSLEQLRESL